MRQNNNQQQNSLGQIPLKLNEIQETSLSQKVFQLKVQLQNTQRHYHSVKKPIKNFAKFKKFLNQKKAAKGKFQSLVLSEKLIPPNIGQNLQCREKPVNSQNPRLKNVFEVYKQTLEKKHKKRVREMQLSALQINVNKEDENQTVTRQTTHEKISQIRRRFSNQKLQMTIILPSQTPSVSYKGKPALQKFHIKHGKSFLLQSIEQPMHNFIRSSNQNKSGKKYSVACYDSHLSSLKQQANWYQVKKKCYTQEKYQEENQNGINRDCNRTKSISFKLPSDRMKTHKLFIEKIGGLTYNLPQIVENINGSDVDESISYLVKSLRKPSLGQNTKLPGQQSSLQKNSNKFSQNSQYLTKKKISLKYHTLPVENEASIEEEYQIEDIIPGQSNQRVELQRINLKQLKYQNRHKSNKIKSNLMEDLQGWNIETQLPELQNNIFHLNT